MSKVKSLRWLFGVFFGTLTYLSTAMAETNCFDVDGMHCGSCVKKISAQLKKDKNIESVDVSLQKATVVVRTKSGATIDPQNIVAQLKTLNYPAKAIPCNESR